MHQKKLENIYREISKFNNTEKKIILSKLITDIKLSAKKEDRYSIMDLRGVGKDIWTGIDAQEYVSQERASWG